MTSVNRFIQFNNETIDTKLLHQMELLAGALADAPYLKVTTRKLIELRPSESAMSISVFWRHRTKRLERNGYLSDIYLLAAGFWRHFNLNTWREFKKSDSALPSLREQLLLCAEEFRLSEQIKADRPGTLAAFDTRETVYTEFHEDQSKQNLKKGFKTDLLINAAYLRLRGVEVGVGSLSQALSTIWTELFDAKTTADSVRIVNRMMDRAEFILESDALHTYYTFGEALEKVPPFHYHEGIEAEETEEPEEIETIEEWFQSWHSETEMSEAPAMEFELERGDSQLAEGGREEEGAGEVQQTAKGDSTGEHKEDSDAEDRQMESEPKTAEGKFGSANDQVVYHEARLQTTGDHRINIENWRRQQAPFVRALLKELKKRMTQKQEGVRSNLNAGRLSKKLVPLAIEERPKPFYRKTAPSKELDAVFCLLIDGSASMLDKLDETKQAVLLFHDVLRGLNVPHEIVLFYEDAYEASDAEQPNYFEWMHKFEDRNKDHAQTIASLDAHEDNRDGFAIRWMNSRLKRRTEKHRFLLVFSDGEPSAYNYAENGVVDTANAVAEAKKQGIEVLHLFLSSDSITEDQAAFYRMMYGNKSVSADSLEQFVEQTLRLLKRSLHLVIQSG
ncbi:von Willebrand factor A [Planococcus antarcticus DSM 14505]|uniref:VWA domain-containing protein n=1 Tax=Planococcus antarcticus DSM 14505 TaxID=1185653 RepID=A0A1C7DGV5_9BACL|nr:VWA domain-containing protein [Planococcus antarcticus]ANU10790.1 VWA domain-containing protein [Planococcus antarcticus DSM 14505]EIM05142.1 von Willebrand factor A [Planococcus antarcticus DSM 14505]